jgi:dienelactone hydrolase
MRWLVACCLILIFASGEAASADSAVTERVLKVPVQVRDGRGKVIEQDITVTVFEVPGRKSYPLLILNHGRALNAEERMKMGRQRLVQASGYFASLGFSVWVPTRVGYGVSGTTEDPEYTGNCKVRHYGPGYDAAADQSVQIIEYAKRRSDVDTRRIVAVGQSFGGTTAIALASRNTPGLVAAINFAGGGGGNPVTRPGEPCFPNLLEDLFRTYGKTARIPTLWIYTENDLYARPGYTQAWFAAYKAEGGSGEFVLLPPYRDNGHLLFGSGIVIWRPIVLKFLRASGFAERCRRPADQAR